MIKKRIWIPLLCLVIITMTLFTFTKLNPPLEIGTIASNGDASLVVIGVGNDGFQGIKIKEVLVNNDETPSMTKIQHSNPIQGFTVAEELLQEAGEFNFNDLSDVTIPKDTSPATTFNKLDHGTASEEDVIYGVSAIHTEKIHRVQLKYTYFRIPFKQTIATDNLGSL